MDTLSVLDWEHAFSQQLLLDDTDFARHATDRGLAVDRPRLESLHRQGVLVPFFAIWYSATAVMARAGADGQRLSRDEMRRVLRSVSKDRISLLEERRIGDLADPARTGYSRWALPGRFRGEPYPRRRFLYSPYQLVGLRELLQLCPGADPLALEDQSRKGRLWRSARRHARMAGHGYRERAILLSLLEAAYRPEAFPELRGFGLEPASWSRFRASFDASAAVAAVGFASDDLRGMARQLLATAHWFDPLANWSDLVGLTHHSHWYKLKGLARLAIDYRVAAEILLLAHESLERGQTGREVSASSGLSWSPVDYRLDPRRERLDATLTRFGLSPHPAVLLVVEGRIEGDLIRRLMDARLRPGWRTAIHLLDAEGVDTDATAAAALVAPRVGASEGDFILLSRPPTRIVVVADPEGPFVDAAARGRVHRKWVDRLLRTLPKEDRLPSVRRDLEGLVEVVVWDDAGNAFEFAHFDDSQIAEAIRSASRSISTPALSELEMVVRQARLSRRNLKSIWAAWSRPQPTKMDVALGLEPILSKLVNDSIDSTEDPPTVPLARILVHVLRLAAYPRHHQFALRRTAPESSESA